MSISEKSHQYYTIYTIPTFGPPYIYLAMQPRMLEHVNPTFLDLRVVE